MVNFTIGGLMNSAKEIRLIIATFFAVTLVGAFILMLPISTTKSIFLIKREFELLLNDISDISLNSIVLNEKLENYDDERLNQELLTLLYKFYANKLTAISYDKDLDFKQKANLIRKIKDNINQLKNGKLVSYNL